MLSTAQTQGLSVSPPECTLHQGKGLGLAPVESQCLEQCLAQSRDALNLCGVGEADGGLG